MAELPVLVIYYYLIHLSATSTNDRQCHVEFCLVAYCIGFLISCYAVRPQVWPTTRVVLHYTTTTIATKLRNNKGHVAPYGAKPPIKVLLLLIIIIIHKAK